ncbi:hypothetical protein PRIPAC_95335 [Pristionchus pacificus]|uniref:Protein kinase domain-containing protein n=1 Tax=Pristionchus pacificus TaxID=54126 RepID=A0A2A6BCA4_PRIPA|nr:hypothetical protein PRIPAC_95335 [Pristionchus pacificus]|eukprot:PDM63498.1 protein kinase [Pristionchus pacificus]
MSSRNYFRRKNYATFYTSQSSMEREVERSMKKKNIDLRSNKPDRPEPVLRDMPTTSKGKLKKVDSKKKKDGDSSGSPSPVTAKRLKQVRSMLRKNESPRSGLKPAHTLGTRSASDYGLVTVGKLLAEQRKLSDFGLIPPVPAPVGFLSPSDLRHTQPAPSRRNNMPPRPPKRSLKDRLRNLRLGSIGGDDNNNPGPSNSQSSQSVKSTVNALPTPEEPSSIRKSISFNEAQIQSQKKNSKKNKKKRESRSSYELSDPSKRRTSVFLKRGSLSMEPIKKVELDEVYGVYKQLGTGRFGYVKLAEHKQSGHKIAIKFFSRPAIKQNDFVREYNYSFFLSPHPHIIDTFEGMFQASDESSYFFVQELCPSASLRELIEHSVNGLGEENTKKVMLSLLSAVEFMHNENLVKVTDFGLTRKVDTQVKHLEFVTIYHAPELCETVVNEVVSVNKTADIWALGIIFYLCTRGRFPWQTATIMCKQYWEWEQWQKRKIPALPKKFTVFSEKALKLLKKTLCNKPKDRWTAKEIRKCVQKEKLLKPAKVHEDSSTS